MKFFVLTFFDPISVFLSSYGPSGIIIHNVQETLNKRRNLIEEEKALLAGLAPGQVRRGLRLLKHSISAFDEFVQALGHDVYFIDPLFYHNAIVFERYGFSYQKGRRLMQWICYV